MTASSQPDNIVQLPTRGHSLTWRDVITHQLVLTDPTTVSKAPCHAADIKTTGCRITLHAGTAYQPAM